MNLEQFASRSLKAGHQTELSQRAGMLIAGSNTRSSAKTTNNSGQPPVAATGENRGANGKLDPSTSRPGSEREWAKGRGQMAAGVTVQQVHWSEDRAWLQAVMADRDQPATVRAAAEKRLRKLGKQRRKL